MSAEIDCATPARRARLRRHHWNGIDEVEVGDDGRTLTVTFLGKAPRQDLEPENIRIDGGRRITGIVALGVAIERDDDPDLDDHMYVELDKAGDSSTYTLSVVRPGPHGRPGTVPYHGFDERYATAEFTFRPGCPADLDCRPPAPAPPVVPPPPVIDYTARDYAALRRLLLDRLTLTLPRWVERHVPDLPLTLVELLAYRGDQISYAQDAVAAEAYLDTARRRESVRRHVRLVDYAMHDGGNARAVVAVETAGTVTLDAGRFRFAAIDTGGIVAREHPAPGTVLTDEELLRLIRTIPVEVFEPMSPDDVTVRPEHNRITFWTWGDTDCRIPAGATTATLSDDWTGEHADDDEHDHDRPRALRLRPGDILIIEEVRGPATGAAADRDPGHRQAVRVTAVEPGVDRLYRQPVLHVTWAPEDALRFTAVLSHCGEEELTVARGNTVLVDHGQSLTFDGRDPEELTVSPPSRPRLSRSPVTQAAPYPDPARIAQAQSRLLAAVPGRARDRVETLWRDARAGRRPGPDENEELIRLFGAATVAALRPDRNRVRALAVLAGRFDTLLAVKLARISRLVAIAADGRVLGHDVAWEIRHSWGPAYAEHLEPDDPALAGPASALGTPDPRAALPAVRLDDGGWTPRRDLLAEGPRSAVFVGELGDDGLLTLRFGDGVHGRPPASGGTLRASYRIGNGAAGNVGAEAVAHLVLASGVEAGGIERVRNPLPATGGADPEPVDVVRTMAPLALHRTRLRAITAADYAELAAQVPGVQRAAASLRHVAGSVEVHVAVDPFGTAAPSDMLLDAVTAALEPYRRIGHDVVAGPADLVPLFVEVTVCLADGYPRGQVVEAVTGAVTALFRPDAVSFGEPVRASRLVAAAMAVPGVTGAEVTGLRRLFGTDDGEARAGLLRLGPLQIAQLDNASDRPENGRLSIDVAGGGR
ncbi:putative baseplate assembly protein [Actinoplanes sp. NPDC049316]|uniref:putative baseplate assembly protein n=1 Tax=Actinoplanes sp. NPDC049316 TaxID=3154727 RepID=UPI00341DE681